MRNEISIREWIERFNNGKYESSDVQTQIEAGWYDWFCKDSGLVNKTRRMGNIIRQIKPDGKIDIDNSYVLFKNNCPFNGPLYDDFIIADIKSNITLFVVQIDNNYSNINYRIFENFNNFKTIAIEARTVKEIVTWFNESRKYNGEE